MIDVVESVRKVFSGYINGTEDYLALLDNEIGSGGWSGNVEVAKQMEPYNLSNSLAPLLYGSTLVKIWKMNILVYPVVM
jgi:hypothetical protein